MAVVAHVLHTPIPALDDMEVDELLAWFEEAKSIMKAARGYGR